MQLKEYVCDTLDKHLLAQALNIPLQDVTSKHSYVMIGAQKSDKQKLESFFLNLRNHIVPNWLQNQALTFNHLVETLKEEYIIS
jgi:hypothetical protein